MSNYSSDKNVHVIVHGQKQLFESIKSKLSTVGFKTEQMILADMNKPGNKGDYVAMLWPPMAPKEIIISQIIDLEGTNGRGMGAWASVNQKELERIPLS
ncbi:MAG: hypothetical protein AB7U98_12880 [Candidatus Nitrosocosmicus sp.]|jgi:hypothetical protein|uniref:hypothetical protein n=1 Tax=Candidatus Nitrosocosmicus sp. FF01 TaxID=3397670 RepID=UPI002A7419EF|nr:hypothetical protein [Candidatus Nitrosocosmicus sp.]GKS62320.1 hypothetical protein YTPLAS21_17780 [Candidatus Nitrosocosmicus sp.]